MSASVGWFLAVAGISALLFCVGRRLGQGARQRAWLTLGVGFTLLGTWAWLKHHPVVAVGVIPAGVLNYIEGIGAAPMFMLVIGTAYALARKPRQRHLVRLAVGMGVVYFVQGGLWMLQATPAAALGRSVTGDLVMQSQDYSCVPAACATALRDLGVPTTEAEMAELTLTRPGAGATLVRALVGVNARLEDTPWRAELVQPAYAELSALPRPLLTTLRTEEGPLHMVVLRAVDEDGVRVADPMLGELFMSRAEFEDCYTGQALVFTRR